MSGWTKARDAIQDTQVGSTGKQVFVVEGEDDRLFFESLLDKVASGSWQTQWCVGVAGGKQNVLRILDDQQSWRGIVDRDEWSVDAATDAKTHRPDRLHVLPRFCMESYFIDPNEVWQALPAVQQAKLAAGQADLNAAILVDLPSWIRHGALWHAVNPLWDGLRAVGFKDALLDLQAAQDDAAIQKPLNDWHVFLEPGAIFTGFQSNLTAANADTQGRQLRNWVHGKRFFSSHVVPSLNAFLGQQSADTWLTDLRRTLGAPTDLEFLWQSMGLI